MKALAIWSVVVGVACLAFAVGVIMSKHYKDREMNRVPRRMIFLGGISLSIAILIEVVV